MVSNIDLVILHSKYWMLEADKWMDLLIICRWANPNTFIIKKKDVAIMLDLWE